MVPIATAMAKNGICAMLTLEKLPKPQMTKECKPSFWLKNFRMSVTEPAM